MESEETTPWPREDDANKYLAEHQILELFNNMTAQLIYNRPDDPKQFLIEVIQKLQKARTTKFDFPCLFDDSNIQSIFGMLDPTGRGYITVKQYREALLTLGIEKFDERPAGAELNRITLDTFMREAKNGLTSTSSTFKAD